MRTRFEKVLAAACGICGAISSAIPSTGFADDTPIAETASAFVYAIDTLASPRAVKTAEELAEIANGTWKATRRPGETVALSAPDGTVTTLAAADSTAASVVLPIDAGGVWTVANSKQGSVAITVRRSLDGTLGDGTASSPAKLVDGGELLDYGASEGYVFMLEDVDGLSASLNLPAGCCMDYVEERVWRLTAPADGRLYGSNEVVYMADAARPGPNRKTSRRGALPVAYSGDNWTGDSAKAATLTFVSPDGDVTELARSGTGVERFSFGKSGDWTVRLEMENGAALEAVLTMSEGFALVVR